MNPPVWTSAVRLVKSFGAPAPARYVVQGTGKPLQVAVRRVPPGAAGSAFATSITTTPLTELAFGDTTLQTSRKVC
ncbi:MAG TPA: hypothetical protein VLC55_09150, partial [Burkholderiales bacterium]|nr:hypothetical protein [Burkholderiales bacterium]